MFWFPDYQSMMHFLKVFLATLALSLEFILSIPISNTVLYGMSLGSLYHASSFFWYTTPDKLTSSVSLHKTRQMIILYLIHSFKPAMLVCVCVCMHAHAHGGQRTVNVLFHHLGRGAGSLASGSYSPILQCNLASFLVLAEKPKAQCRLRTVRQCL